MSLDTLLNELERTAAPSVGPDMERLKDRVESRRRRRRSLRRGAVVGGMLVLLGVAVLRPDGNRRVETVSENVDETTLAAPTTSAAAPAVSGVVPATSATPADGFRAEEFLAGTRWLVTSVESVDGELPILGIELEIGFGELGERAVSGYNGCTGFGAPAVWTASSFTLERTPMVNALSCGSAWADSEARRVFGSLFRAESTVGVASDGATLTLTLEESTVVASIVDPERSGPAHWCRVDLINIARCKPI